MKKKIFSVIMAVFFCFSCLFPANLFADDIQQYMISGMVTNRNDESPVMDAEIIVTGDKEISGHTDIFGYYQIEGIDAGAYLEVSPAKDGLSFSPDSFKISSLSSNRTINFTALPDQDADDYKNNKPAATVKKPEAVVVSASKNSGTVLKPVSGVTKVQPEYVRQTKPFFASETESGNKAAEPSGKSVFDVSGKVIYYASGLVGVKVMINNDRRLMTTTDVNGYFSIRGLTAGRDYTVRFSREGYEFNPEQYDIINGDRDYIINVEASASKLKIHGKISEGKRGIEGATVKIVSGVDEYSAQTDSEGNYEVEGLPHGQNFFVTASKEGVMITPIKVIVNKLASDRIINFNGIVQKFSLKGTVEDSDGNPLKNAKVEIKTTFETYTAATNSKGKYAIDEMPMALTYTMTAGKEGYASSESFVVESLENDREVNFELKKEKEHAVAAKVKAKKSKDDNKTAEDGKAKKVSSVNRSRKKDKEEKRLEQEQEKLEQKRLAEEAKIEKEEQEKLEKERFAEQEKERKQKEEDARLEKESKKEAEKKEKLEQKERAEQEKLEQKRLAEQEKLEQKERAEQEKLEQKRLAEQEKLEQKERAEQEKLEQKRLAEQEKLEQKERAEQEKLEQKRLAEQEKLEQKERAEQERLEKEKQKEAERQGRLDIEEKTEQQEETSKTKIKKSAGESKNVSVSEASSGKEKMVKVKGKIESRGEALKDIEINMSHGYSAKTDEKGRYELSVPAGKRYTLTPESLDFYFDPPKVVFDELKSNAIQDFVPYIAIEGEVFAEGKGVPDVQISVNGIHNTVTSQFGKYRIDKIEYGSPAAVSAAKNGMNLYPNTVEIKRAVKNQENVNFVASHSVAGKITVQSIGVGIGNVNIEVSGSTNTSVVTDFGGNFIILGLVQGGTFEITPKIGGYSFTPVSRKYPDIRESFVGQNFSAVKEVYTVSGNVNIGGKPIRNAVVSISRRALKYYTDDEGNFSITNLDYGGPYTLNAVSREHKFEPVVIELLDKDTKVEFSTDISLGGVVMSGRNPVPDVVVDVNGKKHKTDENGKYLIKGLKYNGDYLLTLSAPGVIFSPQQKEYNGVQKSVLNEVFHASAIINGRVTFNGKPFGGAAVKINGLPTEHKSDSNGYFLIKDLYLGEDYVLELSSPGYRFEPAKKEYKNLSSGKMSENFKAFIDGFSVRGTVTAGGRPLKRVAVEISGTSKKQVLTDDQGEFLFEDLGAGKRYEIRVLSKMHTFEDPSGIIEKLDSDIEINLEPGNVAYGESSEVGAQEKTGGKTKTYYRISGKVTANGNPLQGVSIASDAGKTVITTASGEYTVNLPAGKSVELTPSLYGYVFTPEKYDIKNIKAAASNMNFAARSNTHTLKGRILNKDLKGVKGVSLKAVNSSADFMTDSKGYYEVAGLFHKTVDMVMPDSEDYDFYPENMEVSLEEDSTENDIFAYPKKIKRPEAFVYGGVDSAINIGESYVSIVVVSPEGGKISVRIKNEDGNIIKEFETRIAEMKATAINWDGVTGTGADAELGSYFAVINGAGFKDETLKFRIAE